MKKLTPEQNFEKLLAHANRFKKIFDEKCAALEVEYKQALGGKKNSAITERFITRAKELRAWYDTRDAAFEKALDRLAEMSTLPTSESPLRFRSVSSSTYSSQGFGASKYAEGDAQQSFDLATSCGAKAELRPIQRGSDRWGVNYTDFEVWVCTTEAGLEMLRRKKVNLRDWMKACWARSVNPRVLNPFLPPGLEEKLGIDYYGRDVK
jgi:hypothetical protein